MKSQVLLTIVLVTLLVFSFGCEKERDSVVVRDPVVDQVQWTVLIYASGNYSGDVLAEPVEGTVSRALSTIRVLEREFTPENIATYVCLSSSETAGTTSIYRVIHTNSNEGEIGSELVAELGAVSMGDPATLATFLNTVFDLTSSDKYMLSLCGDGQGWTGMLGDAMRPEGMNLGELRETFNNTVAQRLPDGRLELLCLYARNMGSVETVVELAEHTNYMLTSPWRIEQPHSIVIREWYQDLSAQPQLDAPNLGAYVVDAERIAQDPTQDNFFATLWESTQLNSVTSAFESFAMAWAEVAPQFPSVVSDLRNESAADSLYDPNYIDLARYADLISTAPEFADTTYAELTSAATAIKATVEAADVMRFGSVASQQYGGLNLFYPTGEIDTTVSEAYGELAFSSSAPSWTGVIDSLARRGNSTVTISGEAYWAGHQFHDLYFYADTTIGGAFGLLATGHPTWFELNDTQDTISYSATFDLQTRDSLTLEFGLFIDRDLNGSFNSGDSLGAWNNGQGNFTPFTVYRGTTEEDRNITVRLRRP